MRKRGAVRDSKKCVVGVATFGGIPHESHLHHPQCDQLLLIDVQADTLAFKHWLKNGLKCRLKLAHPASVAVVADSLCCQFGVKALDDTLQQFAPGVAYDRNELFRYFLKRVYHHCSVRETVPESSVKA